MVNFTLLNACEQNKNMIYSVIKFWVTTNQWPTVRIACSLREQEISIIVHARKVLYNSAARPLEVTNNKWIKITVFATNEYLPILVVKI